MITANASTIQFNSIPTIRSKMNTDRPNAAPNEITTVPTITIDATNARVMISITMKIRVRAANAAIMVSYFAPLPARRDTWPRSR